MPENFNPQTGHSEYCECELCNPEPTYVEYKDLEQLINGLSEAMFKCIERIEVLEKSIENLELKFLEFEDRI